MRRELQDEAMRRVSEAYTIPEYTQCTLNISHLSPILQLLPSRTVAYSVVEASEPGPTDEVRRAVACLRVCFRVFLYRCIESQLYSPTAVQRDGETVGRSVACDVSTLAKVGRGWGFYDLTSSIKQRTKLSYSISVVI